MSIVKCYRGPAASTEAAQWDFWFQVRFHTKTGLFQPQSCKVTQRLTHAWGWWSWRVLLSGPTLCGRCVNRTTAWQKDRGRADNESLDAAASTQTMKKNNNKQQRGRCCIEPILTTNRKSAAAIFLKNVAFNKLLRPFTRLCLFFWFCKENE